MTGSAPVGRMSGAAANAGASTKSPHAKSSAPSYFRGGALRKLPSTGSSRTIMPFTLHHVRLDRARERPHRIE